MAFDGIMCTEYDIDMKTGAGVSASVTISMKSKAAVQAEGTVNAMCRYNFSDGYAADLNSDVKYILNDIVSSLAAIPCIAFDMSGYTSRTEAEDMINVLRDGALRGLSILRDDKNQKFINGA